MLYSSFKTKKIWNKKKISNLEKAKKFKKYAGNFEEMLMIFLKKQMNYQ